MLSPISFWCSMKLPKCEVKNDKRVQNPLSNSNIMISNIAIINHKYIFIYYHLLLSNSLSAIKRDKAITYLIKMFNVNFHSPKQTKMPLNSNPLCANATTPLYNETFLAHPTISEPTLYSRLVVSTLLFSFSLFHSSVSFVLFSILHFNENVPRIYVRSLVLVAITCFTVVLHACISLLPSFATPIPSFIIMPCTFFIAALSILPMPVRLINFYGRYAFALAIMQVNIYEGSEQELSTMTTAVVPASPKGDIENQTALTRMSQRVAIPSLGQKQESETSLNSSIASNKDVMLTFKDKERNKEMNSRQLLILKYITSPKAQIISFVLALIPLIIVIISNFMVIPAFTPSANCHGVSGLNANTVVLVIYGAVAIGFSIYAGYLVRKFKDPFGIATETRLMAQYGGIVVLLFFIIKAAYPNVPRYINFEYFVSVGENMMLYAVAGYQIYLAVVERYGLFSFKALGSLLFESVNPPANISLNKVMSEKAHHGNFDPATKDGFANPEFMKTINDPKAIEEFEKFLVGELSAENLRMFVECRRWESKFFDMTDSQRRARAKKIIELFVEIGSLFEVNLPYKLRDEIVAKNEDKNVPLTADLFAKSQLEMLGILYGGFQRYIQKKDSNPN